MSNVKLGSEDNVAHSATAEIDCPIHRIGAAAKLRNTRCCPLLRGVRAAAGWKSGFKIARHEAIPVDGVTLAFGDRMRAVWIDHEIERFLQLDQSVDQQLGSTEACVSVANRRHRAHEPQTIRVGRALGIAGEPARRRYFEMAAKAFPEKHIARMYLGEPIPPVSARPSGNLKSNVGSGGRPDRHLHV
jgi:hypothetical protein